MGIKVSYLLNAIDKIKKLKKSEWDTGINKGFLELSADAKGDVGEIFIFEILFPKLGYNNIIFTRCKIEKDGIYDGKLKNKKIEVKTASLGKTSKTFQHENLYENKSDFHFFVSVFPNYCCLTILSEKDLFNNVRSIMGSSIHSRHDTGAKKFTLSKSALFTKGIPKGFTIKIDETTDEEIKNFIDYRLSH